MGMEDLANKSSNNTTSYIARRRVTTPGTLSLIGFLSTWFFYEVFNGAMALYPCWRLSGLFLAYPTKEGPSILYSS